MEVKLPNLQSKVNSSCYSNVVNLPEKNGGRNRRYSCSKMTTARLSRDLVTGNESTEEFLTRDDTFYFRGFSDDVMWIALFWNSFFSYSVSQLKLFIQPIKNLQSPEKVYKLLFYNVKTTENKTQKNIAAFWLPWQSTIVATVGVRLAMSVRMSLVPTIVRTVVRIEVSLVYHCKPLESALKICKNDHALKTLQHVDRIYY